MTQIPFSWMITFPICCSFPYRMGSGFPTSTIMLSCSCTSPISKNIRIFLLVCYCSYVIYCVLLVSDSIELPRYNRNYPPTFTHVEAYFLRRLLLKDQHPSVESLDTFCISRWKYNLLAHVEQFGNPRLPHVNPFLLYGYLLRAATDVSLFHYYPPCRLWKLL